jgi:hypothetical protein
MKCARFVFPVFGSFAPSAATKTRSGSDSSEYWNSFCTQEKKIRPRTIQNSASYLDFPLLLVLRFVMTETIYGEVMFREIRIDITEPARLCRATRCVFVNGQLYRLEEVSRKHIQVSALGIEKMTTPFSSASLATSMSSPCSFFRMYDGRVSPMLMGASAGVSAGVVSTVSC